MSPSKTAPLLLEQVVCPACDRSALRQEDQELVCTLPSCGKRYPVLHGCPVLINESNSVFSISDYVDNRVTTMDLRDEGEREKSLVDRFKGIVRAITPSNARSVSDFPAESAMEAIVAAFGQSARVLVVGAGDSALTLAEDVDLVYSDVALGGLTDVVCDAHDIPFPDGHFDAVVAVAVMEHVVDPARCVSEIHRVLKPRGFVYSVTPFMQQVHMGRFDFQRFTHVGHRRLFRMFDEERSGVANGPGMVLAWSIERFLSAFSDQPKFYAALRTFSRFLVFPLPYFDSLLAHKRASFDCASGYYFFGRRREEAVSDRDILASYRGIQ
jgi:SAM-dependent methyltransferase